jgi:cell wall-associated NlpC family hydrolase
MIMSKIVEIAKAEIGTTEVPKDSNKTKYGKWFGLDGVAWCGMFVSWCYAMRGKPLPNIGFKKGFAGCQTAVAYFKKNNRIVTKPNPGDIVFFDWNLDGRYDHTGIFVEWIEDSKSFYSVEGNTSLTNQSNGGQVMLRKRNVKGVLFVKVFD